MELIKTALCQITPTFDKTANIEHAISLIKEAASKGAVLVSLPEMFYHPFELLSLRKIAADETDLLQRFSVLAAELGIYLCTGSIACKTDEKIYNRSYLFGPSGAELLSYDKSHLFDVNFKNLRVKESALFTPGNKIVSVETDLGRIGIIICYDIRFPEIFRHPALLGADIVIVPAVFNHITGPAHWDVMMRARAIENQLFLLAVSQGQNSNSSYLAYGHSMVVSPWGDVLCVAGEQEEIVYADLDRSLIEETRNRLPLLRSRRENLYEGG